MNKLLKTSSTSANSEDLRYKLKFPEWESLISKTNKRFAEREEFRSEDLVKRMEYYLQSMPEIKESHFRNPLEVVAKFAYALLDKAKENFISGIPSDEVMNILNSIPVGANEFYSLFEIKHNDYTVIDPRIQQVLGIDGADFNFKSLIGIQEGAIQFHPQDMWHLSRAALIAYMVICTPGFRWTAMHDYYSARVRVNVTKSTDEAIRAAGWLTLQKEVYMGHPETREEYFVPVYHFKRWKVYPEHEYQGTKPYFGGDPYQSKFRNVYWYLLHAQLLDIPVKFILLLHERKTKDRYKNIAQAINARIQANGEITALMDEGQVADCFGKTIRQRIGEALTLWENRKEPIEINNDLEAVACAEKLGLLPIPAMVLDLIYENIYEN